MIFLILQLIINSLSHSLPAAAAKPNLKHERCIICGSVFLLFFFAVSRFFATLCGGPAERATPPPPCTTVSNEPLTTRERPHKNSDRKCFGSKSSTSGVKAGRSRAGRAPGLAGKLSTVQGRKRTTMFRFAATAKQKTQVETHWVVSQQLRRATCREQSSEDLQETSAMAVRAR